MIHSEDESKNSGHNSPHHSPHAPRQTSRMTDSIAVYTKLTILLRMRHELGLEAMLEYLEAYTSNIERHNPELQKAVQKALALICVRRIYNQAFPK